MHVVDLKPVEFPAVELPFEDVAIVEDLTTLPDEWDEEARFQNGLRQAMREANLFGRVMQPQSASSQADLVIRGRVEGRFRFNRFLGFITWLPGPLLLMHTWRGNRYEYLADAEIELLDARTGQVLSTHHFDSHHRLVHRSVTPFPILGVVCVLPALVRAIDNMEPRRPYRFALYEQVYRDLWTNAVNSIAVELAPIYGERRRERVARCGAALNAPPTVGGSWSEFVDCQTSPFSAREEYEAETGGTTVYLNESGSLEIHVVGDEIVRWKALASPGAGDLPSAQGSPTMQEPSAR